MIRLTRRGWNNVIIFAVLFLIILFNFSHKLMMDGHSSAAEDTLLLPEYSQIQHIDYGQHRIQRIGLGWRIQPTIALSESELAAIAQQWQNLAGTIEPTTELQHAYVVSIQLAGESQSFVFKVKATEQGVLIQHQQQLLKVTGVGLDNLIPSPLQ